MHIEKLIKGFTLKKQTHLLRETNSNHVYSVGVTMWDANLEET